jgi:hypothetical protein
MLFLNLLLIWFLVAVFYNNTKDPLVVPDFERKARNLAASEVVIAIIAPLASMSIGFIFWGVFKISDKRFHQSDSHTNIKNGSLIKALLKEMYLRFLMAYFIMLAIFAAVFWYIIEFTAKFGWQVSWMWWYSGTFAFLFNYLFYDPLITWFHSVTYGCSKVLWRKVMGCRSIKIACPEIIVDFHIQPLTEENERLVEEKRSKEAQLEVEDGKTLIYKCLGDISISDVESIRAPDLESINGNIRNEMI